MIQVLIVDDQELFRESLKVGLGVNPDSEATDAVPSASAARELLSISPRTTRLSAFSTIPFRVFFMDSSKIRP